MLQKNYWLDHSSNKEVKRDMKFRTLFCKYPFPRGAIFYNRAFMMFNGGRVSASNAWTISINECSIPRFGAVVNADETTEQIRRLLILKTNLFFAKSPDEIDKFHSKYSSVINEASKNTILPSFFSNNEQNLRETIQELNNWVDRILSFDRKLYKSFCTALAAYEKALQVLSSDPTLSYSLLVFVLEALANNTPKYQATWNHISSEKIKKFDKLFDEDSRSSSVDSTWINELKQLIVNTAFPKATTRFTDFTLEHIPSGFYDSQNNLSQSPIRYSRIYYSIQNAYKIRSDFSHELTSLTQYLISQSNIAEEIEENNQTYLTLRGLFRLVRSVMLEFVERQTIKDLQAYDWGKEFSQNIVTACPAALYRVSNHRTNQLNSIESKHAQAWLEDILTLYQDHYVERLHEGNQQNGFVGISTHGTAVVAFGSTSSYDWKAWKEQSLNLIQNAQKPFKGYLQAIVILCAYLEEIDGGENRINKVVQHRSMLPLLKNFENLVVNIICNRPQQYSGDESENLLKQHMQEEKRKIRLPFRVEIACMIEVARLFQNEGVIEKRDKWLGSVYKDSARYPDFQILIKDALACPEIIIETQAILDVPHYLDKGLS